MERMTERLDGLGVIAFKNPRDIGGIYTITDLDREKDESLLIDIAERLADLEDSKQRAQRLVSFIIQKWHSCPIPDNDFERLNISCKCGFRNEGCAECFLKYIAKS